MDMGFPLDERATLLALVDAAAPQPVPADQALPLLQRVSGLDSEALGRLAYHALTGVDPGSDPAAPGEVLAGFPPFAAEVLMRAICGPDHRRPTPQALVIVLDTVPAGAWPTAGRPHVELDGAATVQVTETATEPAAEPEPATVVEPEVELEPESASEPDAPEPESVDQNTEFRNLLIPSRTVPRFDPLSDPWEPEPALQSEQAFEENPAAADEDEAVEPEVADSEPEVDVEPEPQPEAELEPQPEPEPESEPAMAAEVEVEHDEPEAPSDDAGMHAEFRNLVPTSFEVPRLGPSESDELGVLAEDPRRRSSSGRRRSASGKKSGPSEPRDRGPMLLLIAAIVVLVVLAVVYFAAQQMREQTDDTVTPQGASRVTSQPVDVRP